jgi:CubicO group peptidase (beta-lactamase class C family)
MYHQNYRMNSTSASLLRYPVIICIVLFFLPAHGISQDMNSFRKKINYTAQRPGGFMKNWLIAGPFAIDATRGRPADSAQAALFRHDPVTKVDLTSKTSVIPVSEGGQQFQWQFISSNTEAIDLDSIFNRRDFAFAYAAAEIQAAAPAKMILALGSDDAIKVWHNGKLVHENFTARGLVKDNDLVLLDLVKGSNQILLKIQDLEGGWSFSARLLDRSSLADLLNAAVSNGNADKMDLLINGGADINAVNESGLTALSMARISGREELAQLLIKKGAKDVKVPVGEKIIDHYYKDLTKKNFPGIAVLIAKDGQPLYRKGFGYADINKKKPVLPDTKFRIGSVTKQFTAAAILKLQEANLLNVNDKLSKYIPDFPRGDEVTLHHLLTHTSGIHSYTGNFDFIQKVVKPIHPDSLINAIKKDPYDFNPGERMLYNNSGYFILGYIIGKVSGKPYDVYLQETFFKPLGMVNTGVHYAGIKLDHEAKGYSKTNTGYAESLDWDMSWAGGAGALYSTLDDLLKWNTALYGGKILKEESMKAALTPAKLKDGSDPAMQYGYGLMFTKVRGLDVIGHSGGLHGFITQLVYYPKENISVVMYSNTDQPDVNFDPNKIAEAFIWDKMDKQVSLVQSTEKPKDLARLTGRYEIPAAAAVLSVTSENDRLFARLGGQQVFEIFPMSDTVFFWKVVEAQLHFIKDGTGAINKIALHQGGQVLNGTRLRDETFITVGSEILEKYVGRYKTREGMTVSITRLNDKLYGQEDGQPKVELKPLSETEFLVQEINAKLIFVTDESAKVNTIRLKVQSTEFVLQRIE